MDERIRKALSQPIFLITIKKINSNEFIFLVEGTKGNEYIINKNNDVYKCSCPDFKNRRQSCKHIYFIIYKVLVSTENTDVIKKSNEDCCICFDSMKDKILIECKTCKNLFHKICINQWLRNSNRGNCPLCRNLITNCR